MYQSDLNYIAAQALQKKEEHDHFVLFLRDADERELDDLAHAINDRVSAAVDCTTCGNCCKTLVINVANDEVALLAQYLQLTEEATKDKYIEESLAGNCYINTMPCHFLADDKCTIYEARFRECRDFPHLHKKGFKARLPGTLMHYGRCPIIYNVVEEMKVKVGFANG